jgi:hypothetical protein
MTGMPNPKVERSAIPTCPWCGWLMFHRWPFGWACIWCGAATDGHTWWRWTW